MPNLKLAISIINFLKDEAKDESISADTRESLEVAVQCLQTAYDIDPKDRRLSHCDLPFSLEEIFLNALPSAEIEENASSGGTLKKAEMMKNLGNSLMKSNQFAEAVRYYTAAIELDNQNAIYYGNRAAAYSKLNDFQNAIKDCEKAIEIDPKYAKAYGRMGLAYSSLDQHAEALKAFKKATEIDPSNESYLSNLKLALEKKDKPSNPSVGLAGLSSIDWNTLFSNPAFRNVAGLAGLSSVDWHTLFSNPAFRNMASTLMQDPSIISALSAGMSSSLNQAASASNVSSSNSSTGAAAAAGVGNASSDSAANNPNTGNSSNRSLEMLLEAGQYLAAQMQAANPDLVEQFRQTTSRSFNPPNQDNPDSSAK